MTKFVVKVSNMNNAKFFRDLLPKNKNSLFYEEVAGSLK